MIFMVQDLKCILLRTLWRLTRQPLYTITDAIRKKAIGRPGLNEPLFNFLCVYPCRLHMKSSSFMLILSKIIVPNFKL